MQAAEALPADPRARLPAGAQVLQHSSRAQPSDSRAEATRALQTAERSDSEIDAKAAARRPERGLQSARPRGQTHRRLLA